MIDPIFMSILLGLFVGFVLAITGAGGAILSLPLLVFFLHIQIIEAAPISLMAIMLSAGLGALLGLRKGIVRYKAATLIATVGFIFAPIGVFVAHQLSETMLAILFSLVLFIVSFRALQRSRKPSSSTDELNIFDDENAKSAPACAVNPATSKLFWTASCTRRLILTGGLSGFLSGLLGVGGGFIIVPVLHAISDLETKAIIATSLAVIALVSMVSAFSYATGGDILWEIAVPFVIATVAGMLVGRRFHDKIASHTSMLIFGLLSLTIATAMVVKILVSFF